ncbi:MAG: ABC transporter permease [Candidatus Dactylopiibacterium sp.]|nr:ABC transporter permease [Candidatus Dactylopiibacterium sp.]
MKRLAALARIAAHSAWNRRYSLGLMLLAIALSSALLLGVERLREGARSGFSHSLAGTDLIVGARGSPITLLLYSVFHLGEPAPNLSWRSAQRIAADPAVAWTVPISLGDSHRGFPVIATSTAYFAHYLYGARQPLRITAGRVFAQPFEAVLGAGVARDLGYAPGQRIVLAHGASGAVIAQHGDKPFTIVGVLAPTGTPVDRGVHISLESMEALHLDWQGGMPVPGFAIPPELVSRFDLSPQTITALLVGLKRRGEVFAVQRRIDEAPGEALTAAMPGVALDQLWRLLETGERALHAISALVAAVSLAGLMAAILASLDTRRREMAILRSVGARPGEILALLMLEGGGVTLAGCVGGLALVLLAQALGADWLQARFGLDLASAAPGSSGWLRLAALFGAGLAATLLPAWRAYRLSLADGLNPRL